MAGWDGWAANIFTAGAAQGGAALYDANTGALWGKSGNFECAGNLHQYDNKAAAKDACVPEVNGLKFMFIRNTQDDIPVSLFKKGQDSLLTTKGPSGSRVAVFVKDVKPESVVAKVTAYLAPHV